MSLQTEIVSLKEANFNVKNTIPEIEFENVVSEVSEREKRKNNLMIFNVPESNSAIVNERVEHDTSAVVKVLSALSINASNLTL